jgi:hypothetical protein
MKKRKPPIVLASILIVLVSTAAFMNQKPADGKEVPPPPPPVADEKRETESKSDVAKRVGKLIDENGDSMEKGPAKVGSNPLAPAATGEMGMPAGMKEKAEKAQAEMRARGEDPMKPKPNDSSTSTQWYTEEARKGN